MPTLNWRGSSLARELVAPERGFRLQDALRLSTARSSKLSPSHPVLGNFTNCQRLLGLAAEMALPDPFATTTCQLSG
jgi:hypothetical protein